MERPITLSVVFTLLPYSPGERTTVVNTIAFYRLLLCETHKIAYAARQRCCSRLGTNDCRVDLETSHLAKYYTWFQQGVARWLDIAAYKAMQRIERAVVLDKLVKVTAAVEYSSSAVDTLAIFYQIKVFWQQLAWPDPEGCYSFVAKIVDDICRCSVYYSDKMGFRVNCGINSNKRFEVTKEVTTKKFNLLLLTRLPLACAGQLCACNQNAT